MRLLLNDVLPGQENLQKGPTEERKNSTSFEEELNQKMFVLEVYQKEKQGWTSKYVKNGFWDYCFISKKIFCLNLYISYGVWLFLSWVTLKRKQSFLGEKIANAESVRKKNEYFPSEDHSATYSQNSLMSNCTSHASVSNCKTDLSISSSNIPSRLLNIARNKHSDSKNQSICDGNFINELENMNLFPDSGKKCNQLISNGSAGEGKQNHFDVPKCRQYKSLRKMCRATKNVSGSNIMNIIITYLLFSLLLVTAVHCSESSNKELKTTSTEEEEGELFF